MLVVAAPFSRSTHAESTGQKLIRVTGLQNKKWGGEEKHRQTQPHTDTNYWKVKISEIQLSMNHGVQQPNKGGKWIKRKTVVLLPWDLWRKRKSRFKRGEGIISLAMRIITTHCEEMCCDSIWSRKKWLDTTTQSDTKRHTPTDLWGRKIKMRSWSHSFVNSPIFLKSLVR